MNVLLTLDLDNDETEDLEFFYYLLKTRHPKFNIFS